MRGDETVWLTATASFTSLAFGMLGKMFGLSEAIASRDGEPAEAR